MITVTMAGAMVKTVRQAEDDDLVVRAKTEADALSRLYEMYYEKVFRFCVHRLFYRETAEDVTSTIFLEVARRIRDFRGLTDHDFRSWLYRIAVNQANAYIRKTLRRRRLLARAADSLGPSPEKGGGDSRLDWPRLYAAIMKLKPKHQTLITLRFFEDLPFEQIAEVMEITQSAARVTMHRVLRQLRENLKDSFEWEA
ncbi:MAG: sigma-70 family RNA polymerase sigma factor [Sedimentisphaerales bacterium]|nr:sigma-70 family RNA polymerase sigma factor [Sedimentisphaerales bacterium]